MASVPNDEIAKQLARDALAAKYIEKRPELEIEKLFRATIKLAGSDLHLKVGKPPFVRVKGSLRPINREPIDDAEMVRLCFPMMDQRNRRIFDENGGADFAFAMEFEGKNWRFRVNLMQQLGHVGRFIQLVVSCQLAAKDFVGSLPAMEIFSGIRNVRGQRRSLPEVLPTSLQIG